MKDNSDKKLPKEPCNKIVDYDCHCLVERKYYAVVCALDKGHEGPHDQYLHLTKKEQILDFFYNILFGCHW